MPAAAPTSTFDWEAWRAGTGGVDGHQALEDRAPAPETATLEAAALEAAAPKVGQGDRAEEAFGQADGGRSGRTAVAVLAVVAVCALLGGLAAYAATLGGAAATPAAAPSIAPPGGSGPHRLGGSGGPSLSPTRQRGGQPAAGTGTGGRADPHADPFSPAVTSYLAGRAPTVLAAVYDLRTGQTWTLGHGSPQATGSILKVDILQTLLAQRPFGLSPADRALARSMIENSDNDATTALWNQVGRAAGLRSYNASVGLQRTTPSTCLVCAGFGWPGWGLTKTTAADQLLLLRELVLGSLLTPADRSYAVSLMEHVQPDQRWGVSGGVPAGVQVALKNAWVPLSTADTDWQINSEGWISGRGRDYLIAILTTGNPDEQYGIDTINTVSAMLWTAMR